MIQSDELIFFRGVGIPPISHTPNIDFNGPPKNHGFEDVRSMQMPMFSCHQVDYLPLEAASANNRARALGLNDLGLKKRSSGSLTYGKYKGFLNVDIPRSYTLNHFSIETHDFGESPILGNPHIGKKTVFFFFIGKSSMINGSFVPQQTVALPEASSPEHSLAVSIYIYIYIYE